MKAKVLTAISILCALFVISNETHGCYPSDTTPPIVTITSPTSNPTYSTSSSPLSIGGTASDNIGVTQVTWSNDRGGSGTCSGTTSWSASNITLYSGVNVITVTARDSAGNTGTDTLTVTYTPPDPTPPAAPTNLTANAVSSSQIDLDWDDNTELDLSHYNVHRSTNIGGPYSQVATNVTLSQHSDTGLSASTTYYYVVTAVDTASNESGYSNEASDTTYAPDLPPAAPTDLTANAVSSSQIDLDWDDNTEPDLSHYNVHRSTTPGDPYSQVATNVTLSQHSDTGLSASTTYYYVVTAVDTASNESGYSNEASDTTGPAAPTNLTATAGSSSRIDLQWTDNANDEDGFRIERKISGGAYEEITTVSPDVTRYYDIGLDSSETYTYHVCSYKGDCNSTWSNEATQSPLPVAPSGLTAISGNGVVDLSWMDNTETDFHHYDVYRSLTSGSGYSKINSSDVSVSNYTDNTVTNGTTYYYIVKATDNSSNESSASNEATGFPRDTSPPGAPTGLSVTAIGDRLVRLSWTANTEPDVDSYNVYRSTAPGSGYARIATGVTGVTIVTYDDTTVFNGIPYYYRVTAVDTSGNESPYSDDEASGTPLDSDPPDAPTGIYATAGDSEIIIDWIDNTEYDLDNYRVYRSTTSGFTPGPPTFINSVTSSEYTDSGLTNGTTYYYRIKAEDTSSNLSQPSDQVSATPSDLTPPSTPTNLTATASDGQVELDWDDNAEPDLQDYNIYRSTTSGSSYILIDSVSGTPPSSDYIDATVTNDEIYYYVVTAVDAVSNESDASDEASAMPQDTTAPAAPTGLLCTVSASVSLDWDDNNTELDFASYNVYRDTADGFTPGPGNHIASGLTASEYTDSSVTNGPTYYYVVTAVDTSSNESDASGQVDAKLLDRVYNNNKNKWYASIQVAIDDSADGDIIGVLQGEYNENIVFDDKNITLTGPDPDNPDVVDATIIKGSVSEPDHVVQFISGSNSKLKGFKIRNSGGTNSGIYCSLSNPVISNCIIEDNFFGVFCDSGSPSIENCIVRNNSLSGSVGINIPIGGSGTPTIRNTLIHSINGWGIGVGDGRSATVNNSTIANNTDKGFYCDGAANPTVNSCIVRNNTNPSSWASSDVTYSCLQLNPGGQGNITDPPQFVDPGTNDYHLQSGSLCINAGDPDYAPEEGETDYDGKRRVMAEIIDMGAYEFGEVIHVDCSITTSGDGSDWGDDLALKYLQDALVGLYSAVAGDEIWVAAGEYLPGSNRTDTFQLIGGVGVYGGFAGTETSCDQRDWQANQTILSGDLDENDIADEGLPEGNNSYCVVTGADLSILDGFVVVGGSVDDSATAAGGAGVYCSNVTMTLRNCIIERNMATDGRHGAGIYSLNTSLKLENCLIHGNMAAGNNAGGIYHGNGGAMEVTNCTIVVNAGDGVHVDNASLNISNSILWYNRTVPDDFTFYPRREVVLENGGTVDVAYSNIDGGQGGVVGGVPNWGSGNTSDDPDFESWGYWDLRLVNGTDLVVDSTSFPVDPDQVIIYDFAHQAADFGKGGSHDEDYFVADYLVDKKPYWDGTGGETSTLSTKDAFDLWWNEAADGDKGLGHFNLQVPWVCKDDDKGIFEFNSDHFFPFTTGALGPGDQSMATCTVETEPCFGQEHNWYFTLQYHTTCTFIPGMTLSFKASDDLFVAINDRVVIERGGYYVTQPSETKLTFNADGTVTVHYVWSDPVKEDETYDFALGPDSIYDFDLFYAQRHKPATEKYPVLVVQRTGADDEISPFYISGDYHLQSSPPLPTPSPCIDAGNNNAVPAGMLTDLGSGVRRFDDPATIDTGAPLDNDPYVDMGAYEYQFPVAPVANDDNYSVYYDTRLIVDAANGVLANDTDENEDELTATLVTGVSNGSLTLSADGSFEYTPESGFEGVDSFTYRAEDGVEYCEATVTISVFPPITVYAGEPKEITMPTDPADFYVHLFDAEVDGGDPSATLTQTWSIESVPPSGTVDFDNSTSGIQDTSNAMNPVAYLDLDPDVFKYYDSVNFVLKLHGTDGVVEGDDFVVITVWPGTDPDTQTGPEVDPGSYTIPVHTWYRLDKAKVEDDGKPSGVLYYKWTVETFVVGPPRGEVIFDDDEAYKDTTLNPNVKFTQPGNYALKLSAYDGKEFGYGIAPITVTGGQNKPPTVEAGSDYITSADPPVEVKFANLAPQQPSAYGPEEDDDLTYLWSVSGPVIGATFNSLEVLQPEVTFTKAGTYVCTLTVNDGHNDDVSDSMKVIIKPYPDVYAGENKPVTATSGIVNNVELDDARVREYALPIGNVDINWSSSNPSLVHFSDSTIEKPTVTIDDEDGDPADIDDIVGVYELTLTANDPDMAGDVTDTVWITVNRNPNLEPTLKKSVYVISDTDARLSEMKVYEIDEQSILTHQTNHTLDTSGGSGSGAVGLGIDKENEFLFVTFELHNVIEVVDAKTMTYVDTVTAPGACNLADIVVDQGKQKVYTVGRDSNRLYVYSWDPVNKLLTRDGIDSPYVQLDGLGSCHRCMRVRDCEYINGAYGIALDEQIGRLYVTDGSNIIRYYNSDPYINTDYAPWQKMGEIDVSPHNAIGIAVDVERQYLYTGTSQFGDVESTTLCQYDITNNTINATTVGSIVLGISVDEDTGYVYLTTYVWGELDCTGMTCDHLFVYDSNLTQQSWDSGDIGNPSDVVVGGNVAFKYDIGTITKTATFIEDQPFVAGSSVSPLDNTKDEITYDITYNIQYQPLDPTGVAVETYITDYLSRDVDFVWASHQAIYDPDKRKVTWYLGDLLEGASGTFQIKVKVNEFAKPGGVITNRCEIESNARYTPTENSDVAVDWWADNKIIYVNQNGFDGSGTSWETAYKYLDEALLCAHNYIEQGIWENGGEIWVAAGLYNPAYVENELFTETYQMFDGVDLYGGFKGNENSIEQRDSSDPASETTLRSFYVDVDYVITGADNVTIDGFTIQGGYKGGVHCGHNGASFTISNCIIEGSNEYAYAAGIYCRGSSPLIQDCKIQFNLNGIYAESFDSTPPIPASPVIQDCEIQWNEQSGIYSYESSPVIKGSKIRYNEDHGVYCYKTVTPEIINNWICDNGTDGSGYGIYLHRCSDVTTIRNNTIAYNDDYGIRLYLGSAQPVISNCIIVSNGSNPEYNLYGATFDVSYSCIEDGESDYSVSNNNSTYDPQSDDPLFENASSGDYHLMSSSPYVRNTGNNTGIPSDEIDVDGEPRIIANTVDIGGDEYTPAKVEAGSYKEVTLPLTGSIDVKLDDASLADIDLDNIPAELTVRWSKLSGADDGIIQLPNPAATLQGLNPTITFVKSDIYVLKLLAYNDLDSDETCDPGEELGADIVVIKVNLGIDLTSTPEQTELPDNSVQLSANFVGGTPDTIQLFGHEEYVSFDYDNGQVVGQTEPIDPSYIIAPSSIKTVFTGGPAIYELVLIAYDSSGYLIGEATIQVPVSHQLVHVNAGDDQTIIWPDNRVNLDGSINGYTPDSVQWDVSEEAEPLVTFGDDLSLQTWIRFDEPGIYEIGLLALDEDGNIVGVDTVVITVNPPDYGQLVVDAGQDQQITLPQDFVFLSGSVTGTLPGDTIQWEFSGQAGLLDIVNPASLNTKVTFQDIDVPPDGAPEAGDYILNLVVRDSLNNIIGVDNVVISVNFNQVVVDAGEDQTVVWSSDGVIVNLNGNVISGDYDSVQWIDPSGGLITFGNGLIGDDEKLQTTATIAQPGEYHISLVAKDENGNYLAGDVVVIIASFEEVVIDAGQDQEIIDYPYQSEVSLNGRIIEGDPASTEWMLPSVITDEGPEYYGPTGSLSSWVKVPGPGIYPIGLVARNGAGDIIGWDEMTLTVYPESCDICDATVDLVSTNGEYEVTLDSDTGTATIQLRGDVGGSYTPPVEWLHYAPAENLTLVPSEDENYYYANITFYRPGIYDISLQVRDEGNVVAFDAVRIVVNPQQQWDESMSSCTAAASYEDQYGTAIGVILPTSGSIQVNLESTVTGTGTYYTKWVDPTATGLLNIDNPEAGNTHITFDSTDDPGVYNIDFVVRDTDPSGDILAVIDLYITVYPADYIGGVLTVDAGEKQEVTLPPSGNKVRVKLDGSVSGLCGLCTTQWISPSLGADDVEFDDAGDPQTWATVEGPAIYELKLIAKDELGRVLAFDRVTIVVHYYESQGLFVEATATPSEITLSVDESVSLSGILKGESYAITGVEWLAYMASDVVHFANSRQLDTTATFDAPGVYMLILLALDSDMVIGWDTVDVTVNEPKINVTIKARKAGTEDSWVEQYSAIFDSSVGSETIALNTYITGTGEPGSMSYQWSVSDGDDTEVTFANETSKDTDVTITASGVYELQLDVKEGATVIGRDRIKVILLSDVPLVWAGRGYPLVGTGVDNILRLDKAYVYDIDFDELFITWTYTGPGSASFSYDAPDYSKQNPGVWFDTEGIYTLTLSYNDGVSPEQQDIVDIVVKDSDNFVYAGADKTTTEFSYLPLFDAFACPPSQSLTYQWTVTEYPDEAKFKFRPSASALNPKVSFDTAGDYELTLTVHDGGVLFGLDKVSVRVDEFPLEDDTYPALTVTSSINDGDTACVDASGDISITVDASDDNLYTVYLQLVHVSTQDSAYVEPDDVTIIKGTRDNPQQIELEYSLDTHSLPVSGDGDFEIRVYAIDKGHNQSTDTIGFTNGCVIHSFKVNPEIVESAEQNITFTANLSGDPAPSGSFRILNSNNQTVYGPETVNHPVNVNGTASSLGLTVDGPYKAKLEADSDVAYVYFDVLVNAGGLSEPTAEITNLENGLDYGGEKKNIVQSNPLPEVNEGLFVLEGTACHDIFPDDVYYKIEVYDSRIKAYEYDYDVNGDIVYLYENWKYYPEFIVKNVTPGQLEDGYYHGCDASGVLGELDFSGLQNGAYLLLLTVECHGKENYDSVKFALNCPLKIGNIKFSQEDMVIPVGNYPLRVIRSYDGFNKDRNGDFGYGWVFDFGDLDVELNEERYGEGLDSIRIGGDFDRDVTLTLPDGRRVTFVSYMDGRLRGLKGEWYLRYLSPEGVDATLRPLENERLIYMLGTGYYWDDDTPTNFAPIGIAADLSLHDISGWVLRTSDGTQYNVNRPATAKGMDDDFFGLFWKFQSCGEPYLDSIVTESGETIDFEGDKVIYKDCTDAVVKSIYIKREFGRIIEIYPPSELDPSGEPVTGAIPAVKYEYDSYGNLEKVKKLVDRSAATEEDKYEITTYVYEDSSHSPTDHFVTDIEDERGLSPIRYVYDDSGKLIAIYDAKNNYIELQHDIEGRTETVKDRSGNETIYAYDDRGRVTYTLDVTSGAQTVYTYNQYDLNGQTYTNAYPDKPCIITDPAGNNTYYQYDDAGRTTVVIDPELNVTATVYDNLGSIVETSQWRPLVPNAVFPDDYPETEPSDYAAVSRTVNGYYYRATDGTLNIIGDGSLTNLLAWTEATVVFDDPVTTGIDETKVEHTTYDYDSKNRMVEIRKIDPDGILPDIVTTYNYNAASNSPDQPYKISDPYYDGDPVVYTRYFKYDDNGNQVWSWYEWNDPSGDVVGTRYVYNVTDYDGQGRSIMTRRLVDDECPFNEASLIDEVVLNTTEYDSIGKVHTVEGEYISIADGVVQTGAEGTLTVYEYDELGNLVETRTFAQKSDYDENNPYTNVLTISRTLYDDEGRVLVTVDQHDYTDAADGTENVYDSMGRVIETRRWAEVDIPLDNLLDSLGDVVGRKVPDGVKPANAWDGTGPTNIGWTSEADDGDSPGELPVVKSTIVSGDEVGPLSYTRTIYDDTGRVKHSVALDESGAEQPTTYEYDNAGKQTAVIDPLGHDLTGLSTTTIALYDGIGVNATKIDYSGFVPATHLTGNHRTETEYEGMRRKSVTDARSNTTSFEYDALGRLIQTNHPLVDLDGVGGATDATFTYVGYDGLGRKEWQSETTANTGALDSRDGLRGFEYDAAGRLVKVVMAEPDADTWVWENNPNYRYFYDDYGNLAGILDSLDRLTVFKYNELSKQTTRYMPFEFTDPTGGEITIADIYDSVPTNHPEETRQYDELGRIDESTDYKGQVTLYEYYQAGEQFGRAGQLEYREYYDGDPDTTGVRGSSIEYTYDALGRKRTKAMIEYDPADGITITYLMVYEHVYDDYGDVMAVNVHDLDGQTYGTYRTWLASLDNTYLVDSTGYDYDMVTGQRSIVCTPASATVPAEAQTWVEHAYDGLGRLADVDLVRANGNDKTLAPAHYEYNPVGSRQSLLYTNSNYTYYKYDPMNRLTSLANYVDDTEATTLSSFAYTHYADGMRYVLTESLDGGTTTKTVTYTYDNLNRIDTETGDDGTNGYTIDYDYDLAGNRTQREVIAGGQMITTTYAYDAGTDQLLSEVHAGPEWAVVLDGKPYYAYAGAWGWGTTYRDSQGRHIGPFKAFFLGLPTEWSQRLLSVVLMLLPVALLLPVVGLLYVRLRKVPVDSHRRNLSVFYRCVSVLLAYMILIHPACLQQLAQGAVDYSGLDARQWHEGNRIVEYGDWDGTGRTGNFTLGYDANGSVTKKITWYNNNTPADPADDTKEEEVTYEYNLQNRLSRVITDDQSGTLAVKEYKYNPQGIRVEAYTYETAAPFDENAPRSNEVITDYLIDAYNHTGYAQVFVEDDGTNTTSYVIGDDVLAQVTDSADPQYLLYDGHGSTRQLMASDGSTVDDSYSYDAYGVMLGGNPTSAPTTSLLYAGEQFDVDAQMYYLRARYYNPSNGLFNRMDPFAGSRQDPQSLHKYLYVHCNPVNSIDPSGEMTMGNLIAFTIVAAVFVTVLAIVVGPPLYKLHRVSTLVRHSEIMDSHILEEAIRAGDRYWSGNKSWKKLRLFVGPGGINPLTVMVTPLDKRIGGFHLYYKQGYVFVSQNAVDDGALATAFTIFAEWTHDRWLGEGLNEEQAQEAIDILIKLLPEEERHGDFIDNYGHGWF